MKTLSSILCSIALVIACGCSDPGQPEGRIPDFRIVELQDTSTGEQRSFRVKIVLPAHCSEESVRSTLATISKTLNEPESEITVLFYGPHSDPRGVYDVARVVWTDNGIEEINYKQPVPAK